MKTLIAVLLLSCCLTPARASADCASNADACTANSAKNSPFLTAAAEQPAPVKLPAPAKTAPAAARPGTPPAVSVSSAAVPGPSMPASSSPLWLIFVGVCFAALYFYLGSAERRRKR